MMIKVAVPNQFKMRIAAPFRTILFPDKQEIHYIGGTDVLPPPLEAEKENEMIMWLGTENEDKARKTLIEHNLRLVVYIAKKFDNTGVGIEDLISIGTIGLIKAMEVSIDEPLNVDWDGNELLLSDILGTEEDAVSKDMETESEHKVLHKAVNRLPGRERMIVQMRFGIGTADGEEKTQKEVADLLGISQSYISRLEKKIMQRLKKEIDR